RLARWDEFNLKARIWTVKQLFGGSLTLRDYDGQVAEALVMVRALNKMTKAGMPESVRIA
ncbi:IS5/IS1182 family transposase, partial [Salmonella enterica]|nr:IS5/IS1182 family transposase [Salmonella enterica]